MSLHKKIAKVLGWSTNETHGFSLQSLRELVRPVDPKLADEISQRITSGDYIREDKS